MTPFSCRGIETTEENNFIGGLAPLREKALTF